MRRGLLERDILIGIHKGVNVKEVNMAYLMIVKREGEKWVVAEDSVHLLEDEGGNYPVQELTISQIRAIEAEDT